MAHFSSVIRRACSQAASFSAMHLKHRSQTSESSVTRVKLLSPAPDFTSATGSAGFAHAKDCPALPVSVLDNGKKRKLRKGNCASAIRKKVPRWRQIVCTHCRLRCVLSAAVTRQPDAQHTLRLCVQQQGQTARLCTFLPSPQGSWVDRIRCS